ncbi:hypothetical protein RvY_14960 [Ramazzottius varieornatus]|uniref:1-acyl-sn-glycerol-3-phosphate acyltransferase n=1 Tax=Ramazzottius varieornatus TaxID=947166 RepID=A0A1D1VUV0_RAMVA|nr:hypothetical protein RvY_14960 [Ramazzottius varieornatus]
MDPPASFSGFSSDLFNLLQYLCMLSAILIPVIWKIYVFNTEFRFYGRHVFYGFCVMLTSLLSIPLALRNPGDPSNARDAVAWIFVKLLKVPQLFGITVEARGLKNFDVKGPFIVVCNHQTSLDLIPMCSVLPSRCASMAKRELMYAGPFGLAFLLSGGVFVDRRPGKSRDTIERTVRQLKQKNAGLWIFPEGTRNHAGGLLPFKKGAFLMAVQGQFPVIPVIISSYSAFYDLAARKFESGKVIVTVLPPVSSKPYTVDSIQNFVDDVTSSMLAVYELSSKEALSGSVGCSAEKHDS